MGGRELGRTPATVSTFAGLILTLRRAGFLEAFVAAGTLRVTTSFREFCTVGPV